MPIRPFPNLKLRRLLRRKATKRTVRNLVIRSIAEPERKVVVERQWVQALFMGYSKLAEAMMSVRCAPLRTTLACTSPGIS